MVNVSQTPSQGLECFEESTDLRGPRSTVSEEAHRHDRGRDHGAANHPEPVTAAPLANVAVDLAQHPSDLGHSRWTALRLNFPHEVTLYRSLNNGYLDPLPITSRVVTVHDVYASTPVSGTRYEFDDVGVSAARDPANTYFFAVGVDGVMTDSVLCTHGADARTYFPVPDVSATSDVGC